MSLGGVKDTCERLKTKIDETSSEAAVNINRLENRVANMIEHKISEIDVSSLEAKGPDDIPHEGESELRKLINRVSGLESLVMNRLTSIESTKA